MEDKQLLDTAMELVPIKGGPRATVRALAGIFVVAVVAIVLFIGAQAAADSRVTAKTKPLRIMQMEDSAVLDHIYEDVEEMRDQQGKPKHRLSEVREAAREKALKAEQYRETVQPE